MATIKSFGQISAHHLALVILSPILVFGYRVMPREDHEESQAQLPAMDQAVAPVTLLPWENRHDPPPTPYLPPMPPKARKSKFRARREKLYDISLCGRKACTCKNRSKDGKEVVDVSCSCGGTNGVLKIWEGMLPELADTLEIADCGLVRLEGLSPSDDASDEDEPRTLRGRPPSRSDLKLNFPGERRRRREVQEEDTETTDEGGVEWEEAVWEAELGSPDDEEEDETEEPPEEEEDEQETTTEGEESEKGGRYARAASDEEGPRPLSFLSVRRTKELRMKSHAVGPVRSVLLEDVGAIRVFPPYAFQPPPPGPSIHPSGFSQAESLPHAELWEMESVTFRNVSDVERFSENAFSNVLIRSHFLWYRTNVVVMDHNAIRVMFRAADEEESVDPCETSYRAEDGPSRGENTNSSLATDLKPEVTATGSNGLEGLKTSCEAPQGGFTVTDSVISMWNMNAFSINGARSVVISGCITGRLSPSSINVGSANFFSFTRNTVLESVSMFAFSVTASFVDFRRNRFGRLEEGAMSGVKPMASKISYGLPHMAFEDNLLIDVDLLSLHPSWDISPFHNESMDRNATGFSFRKNAFADCSCPHIGWIVQLAGEQELSSNFYFHLLDDGSGNYCVKEPVEPMGLALPCRLPLKGISSLFEEDGITCKRHVDVVKLCDMYKSVASKLLYTYYFQGLFALVTLGMCTTLLSP